MWVVGKKNEIKKKEKISGTCVMEKKKKKKKKRERIYNGNRGREWRKMRKEGILGVVKKKRNFRENNKNEYLNEIELRIENEM